MVFEYSVMAILFFVGGYMYTFYSTLSAICLDMISGKAIDENNKPLNITEDQKPIIMELINTAKSMKGLAVMALWINMLLLVSLNTDIPLMLKIAGALVNAPLLAAAVASIAHQTSPASFVQK